MIANPTRWLRVASVIFFIVGINLALGVFDFAAAVLLPIADLVFWPLDGNPVAVDPLARLMSGITGGLMCGWGVMFFILAGIPEFMNSDKMRRAALYGAEAWFLVDSAASITVGAWVNVIGNVGFLALLVLPLLPASTQAQPRSA